MKKKQAAALLTVDFDVKMTEMTANFGKIACKTGRIRVTGAGRPTVLRSGSLHIPHYFAKIGRHPVILTSKSTISSAAVCPSFITVLFSCFLAVSSVDLVLYATVSLTATTISFDDR